MEEKQKIYIRGSKDRPDDVRKILEQYGGKVEEGTNFTLEDCIYYIGHNGVIHYISDIDFIPTVSELYKMITKYYHEVILPNSSECWKRGDILANNNDPKEFFVFDKFSEKGSILVYLAVDSKAKIEEGCHVVFTPRCHKVNAEELKTFYDILAARNLTWDAYDKKLLYGNNTYFYPKNRHYYFIRRIIKCKDRTTGEWYDAVLYSDAKGQYVRELNDFNAKFKKI